MLSLSSSLTLCAVDSARFATVMFMFRHRGRVRVALSEQDAAGGGVDRLFDNALAAGAEDFDQVTGADQGVEVEVRFIFASLDFVASSHQPR
jgi:transcriptional/translational regulatory protein YebC/TACO1